VDFGTGQKNISLIASEIHVTTRKIELKLWSKQYEVECF